MTKAQSDEIKKLFNDRGFIVIALLEAHKDKYFVQAKIASLEKDYIASYQKTIDAIDEATK